MALVESYWKLVQLDKVFEKIPKRVILVIHNTASITKINISITITLHGDSKCQEKRMHMRNIFAADAILDNY